eukprot:3797159-Rhodomonas_salina.1
MLPRCAPRKPLRELPHTLFTNAAGSQAAISERLALLQRHCKHRCSLIMNSAAAQIKMGQRPALPKHRKQQAHRSRSTAGALHGAWPGPGGSSELGT